MASEIPSSDGKRIEPVQTRGLVKAQRMAINAFLIFHILAITCWCLPFDNALVSLCRERVRPYLVWSGLFQAWDMFSPNPKSANTYVEATITYPDRSRATW